MSSTSVILLSSKVSFQLRLKILTPFSFLSKIKNHSESEFITIEVTNLLKNLVGNFHLGTHHLAQF